MRFYLRKGREKQFFPTPNCPLQSHGLALLTYICQNDVKSLPQPSGRKNPENNTSSVALTVGNREAMINRKPDKTWERGRNLRTALAKLQRPSAFDIPTNILRKKS